MRSRHARSLTFALRPSFRSIEAIPGSCRRSFKATGCGTASRCGAPAAEGSTMHYVSTRGQSGRKQFCETLLEGLAQDGGLYVPESYPRVDSATLKAWPSLPYSGLAFELLSLYVSDIPPADLKAICEKTYPPEVFGCPDIAPLRELEPGLYLQGLSNGPTLAFKDMAMQLLGNLLEYELARRNEDLNILGATSGDTGSAAEYAMRGKK